MTDTRQMAELAAVGQSVWLDYIRRDLTTSGELEGLVADGLRGMTSNPTIFDNAIGGSDLYDEAIAAFAASHPDASAIEVFEHVAIEDIQAACDVLSVVHDETGGRDGFVSLEVSPTLVHDTAGTIAEAKRLWAAVDRPNLMIKVPGTAEGLPAITELIGSGVNINVTLLFSIGDYEAVVGAYLAGLERCDDPSSVHSVASMFISRIDTAVDAMLDEIGSEEALALRGKVAVAHTKVLYARAEDLLLGDDFEAEWGRGVAPQRPLWASLGVKNPDYSDLLYVEPIVGAHTVSTMPPVTLEALLDGGVVAANAVTEGVDEARATLDALARLGIDIDAVCKELQDAGADAFVASFQSMLDTIDAKRSSLTSA